MGRFFTIALTIFLSASISACAAPIETRVQSHSPAKLPEQKLYAFTADAEQQSALYREVRTLVAEQLSNRGFEQKAGAALLIHIAAADRLASVSISAGEGEVERDIASAKKRKPFQSCADQEHRLSISIIDRSSGTNLYSGSAAEYHCKAAPADTAPHLVRAALADLGTGPNDKIIRRTQSRAGRD